MYGSKGRSHRLHHNRPGHVELKLRLSPEVGWRAVTPAILPQVRGVCDEAATGSVAHRNRAAGCKAVLGWGSVFSQHIDRVGSDIGRLEHKTVGCVDTAEVEINAAADPVIKRGLATAAKVNLAATGKHSRAGSATG